MKTLLASTLAPKRGKFNNEELHKLWFIPQNFRAGHIRESEVRGRDLRTFLFDKI